MSQSSSKGEKITAVVSTLVALVILAVGVTAQQNHAKPQDELVQLESDLRFQLDRAFRHDTAERYKRLTQLESVITAWEYSAQSEKDREILGNWLLEATIRSMPGTGKHLPQVPEFGVVPSPSTQAVTQSDAPSTVSQAESIRPKELVPEELTKKESPAEDSESPAFRLEDTINVAEQGTLEEPDEILFPNPEENQIVIVSTSELENATSSVSLVSQPLSSTSDPKPTVKHPQEVAQINIYALSARIATYHQALDQVETQVLALEETDLEVFAKTLKQLQGILQDYQFAKLYYDALDSTERKGLRAPRSPRPTLLEIDRRIENQQAIESGDFLSGFETSRLNQTKALRHQIATLANALGE